MDTEAQKRMAAQTGVVLLLLTGSILLRQVDWEGGFAFHALTDTIAMLSALLVGVLALIFCSSAWRRRDCAMQSEAALRLANAEIERTARQRSEELEETHYALQSEMAERRWMEKALRMREQQQTVLALLGAEASTGTDLYRLFDKSVSLVAQTLQKDYDRVLQYLSTKLELCVTSEPETNWPSSADSLAPRTVTQPDYPLFDSMVEPDRATDTDKVSRLHVLPESGTAASPVGRHDPLVGSTGLHPWEECTLNLDETRFIQIVVQFLATAIERIRAESELRENSQRFDLAVRGTRDGLWDAWVHPQDPFHPENPVFYSPRFKELLGYDHSDFRHAMRSWTSRLHQDDREWVLDTLSRHLANHEPCEIEYRMVTRQGEVRWFTTKGQAMWDESGHPIRMAGSLSDITTRKQAEEALRESEARFRSMADTAPVLIWMSGPDQRCTYVNKRWLDFTGRTLEQELAGGWAEDIHPDDVGKSLNTYVQAFEARRPFQMEYRLKHVEGPYRWVLDSGAPRFTPSGELAGYIGSCTDITERKSLEAQLFQAQKMEAIGRLAGGVAHDFNNLLTVIKGYSDLLLNLSDQPAPLRKTIEEIKKAADRATALTNRLLAFSRKDTLNSQVVDLNTVILGTESLLRRLIGEDIELVTSLATGRCSINADPVCLEQVLINLAVNARDAMPHGGRLTIKTARAEQDRVMDQLLAKQPQRAYVMLSVGDTGVGMDAETQARIFEPFFTTKPIGKGTGLGLSMVYSIIEQNSGTILVASAPGEGSTFTMYLPLLDEPRPAVEPPSTAENLCGGTETILLVEDDAQVRALTRTVLQDKGYQVIEASNGTDALSIAETHRGPIHLLLTDAIMPQMGGQALAERLLAAHPHLRVFFFSGYTDDVIAQHGRLDRNWTIFQKPFSNEALTNKVREVLDSPLPDRAEPSCTGPQELLGSPSCCPSHESSA